MKYSSINGYVDANKLYLLEVGNTAVAKVTYHTFKYDAAGNETGVITKEFTITAVEDGATVSNSNYTVEKNAVGAVNWNTLSDKKNSLALNDNAKAFFYFVDSEKNDVTTAYSVESSDNSVLLLSKTTLTASGDKGSAAVVVTGVKAGSAYINVLNSRDKVVASLPVVVKAERKLTSVEFGKAALTVSSTVGDLNTVETTIKGLDQYGEKTGIASIATTILSAPSAETTYVKNYNFTSNATLDLSGKKVTFNAAGLTKGTYQLKVTATSTLDPTVTVSRTVTLNVVDTSTAGTAVSYGLSLSSTSEDLAIASDVVPGDAALGIVASVVKYKKGAIVEVVTGASIVVTDAKGASVTGAPKISDDTAASGELTINLVSETAGTVTKNFAANEVGTYKVTGTIAGATPAQDKVFVGTFTLKDTQTAATVDVKKTSDITAVGATVEDKAEAVLETAADADFYYEGVKLTTVFITVPTGAAKVNGKALYIGTVYVQVTTTGELTLDVPVTVNKTFILN